MKVIDWKTGDWLIYRKPKRSASPGPRAEDIQPARHGEEYSYIVEKYWIVEDVLESGELQLLTKTGKRHVVPPNDIHVRKPNFWERFVLKNRFAQVESTLGNVQN